jgi:transcriptional regulator with XRE-family HTH domain
MSAPRKRQRVNYFDDPVLLGGRLRETREAAGLSQRELSFPGCTAAYISRIEKGERVPSLQLIREFAVRLDVSEEFISHGTVEQRDPELAAHALYELATATFERLPPSDREAAYAKFAALLEQRATETRSLP